MRLLAWNIQWCRGTDGRVDPARIAREIRRIGDPEIVCLQEVASNFDALPGSAGEDQPAQLAQALGAEAHVAWAVDIAAEGARRARFGNLIVSRLPVRRVLRHSLPWPAAGGLPSMPRVALEAEIEVPWGALRVLSTHLEYYSAAQRAAQVERLRELHAEACAHALAGPPAREAAGPFRHFARPTHAIVCGDFNFPPDDPLHARLAAPFGAGIPALVDAWTHLNPGVPHPPTFRLHDPDYAGAPYCCDYVFASEDFVPRLASMLVDLESRASDHQPLIVEFD